MVVADAVIRKLPGALGHADSAVEESFSQALGGAPEYPHYTARLLSRVGGARGAALRRSRAGAANGGWSKAAGAPATRLTASGSPLLFCRPRGPSLIGGPLCATGPGVVSGLTRAARSPGAALAGAHEHDHREHRAASAEAGASVRAWRPGARPLPGRRGHPASHPGVRGRRDRPARRRREGDVHGPQAVVRGRRRAHLSRSTRRRSSGSRWWPGATCGEPSSTTCAAGSASAPGSPSGAGGSRTSS